MATSVRPVIMAPGVYFQEVDESQFPVITNPNIYAQVAGAMRGEKDAAVLITSFTNYVTEFGFPGAAYPGGLNAREWFAAGGGPMYMTRVGRSDVVATASVNDISTGVQTVNALTSGSYFNGVVNKISYGTESETLISEATDFLVGTASYPITALPNLPLVAGSVVVNFVSTEVATDDGAGNLVFGAGYSAYSGTVNYNTGVVTIHTTSLGAANNTTVNITSNYWTSFNWQIAVYVYNADAEVVGGPFNLENYNSLTLATMVKQLSISNVVSVPSAFTHFPIAGTYTFSGGTDGISGLLDSDYIGNTIGSTPTGLQNYAYPDQLSISILAIPGVSDSAVIQAMTELVEIDRADTLAIFDPPPSLNPQNVAAWANGTGSFSANDTIDTNYGAIYWPYYLSYNNITNDNDLTPPSAAGIAALARSNPWEAPAGPTRGILLNCQGVQYQPNLNDRQFLYGQRINPISNLAGLGIMVLGQNTATLEASTLDRVADRMMLMVIEKAVVKLMYQFLFQPNTPATWNQAVQTVSPYMNYLVKQSYVYAAQFFCDANTNSNITEENNIMACNCYLQLLDYAEIIAIAFILQTVGATISESIVTPSISF